MSPPARSELIAKRGVYAPVFAALGDPTRLSLLAKLCGGQPCSISTLTADTKLTRQAVTKHLRVLQQARLVHSTREGRESRFALDPQPIEAAKQYLDLVSKQWDDALGRLRAFVES
jgi:DNA-binding transcriptional ArsR family regulator